MSADMEHTEPKTVVGANSPQEQEAFHNLTYEMKQTQDNGTQADEIKDPWGVVSRGNVNASITNVKGGGAKIAKGKVSTTVRDTTTPGDQGNVTANINDVDAGGGNEVLEIEKVETK